MNLHRHHILGPALVVGTLLLWATIAEAGKSQPTTARHGLELATDAAQTWSDDARLIYVENDEDVLGAGSAERWGYLFYSATRDRSRAYSVKGDKIEVANDLSFKLDAPPVHAEWIDSARALKAAEDAAGADYRKSYAGHLRSMLLIRGAFHQDDPDKTTWTLVYDSSSAPSLFVVVDAASGKVVRRWKG